MSVVKGSVRGGVSKWGAVSKEHSSRAEDQNRDQKTETESRIRRTRRRGRRNKNNNNYQVRKRHWETARRRVRNEEEGRSPRGRPGAAQRRQVAGKAGRGEGPGRWAGDAAAGAAGHGKRLGRSVLGRGHFGSWVGGGLRVVGRGVGRAWGAGDDACAGPRRATGQSAIRRRAQLLRGPPARLRRERRRSRVGPSRGLAKQR
jgi:hypothetical protein